MQYENRKQFYRDAIVEYMNNNPHHFIERANDPRANLGQQPYGRLASMAVPLPSGDDRWPSDPQVQRAQELLIIPGRPWWMFWRPSPLEPPAGYPRPPGWTPEWKWRYPDRLSKKENRLEPRWVDPKGGEFRWNPPDRHHPNGHWDYNPWHRWNDHWRNVLPPREGPFSTPPTIPAPHYDDIWA